jgi:TM2 domain-containing membrane protein YozV
MDCVNHPGVSATAFCQNCGKALCANCVRTAPGGQVLCEPCFAAWQTYQQPFTPNLAGGPNPAAAAVLGLIPGVGAMYNGQFFKGLIHVVIFAVLVSMAHISGIFGIFIPAWIIYQAFEAFHTARALQNGQPVPDPLGLNEVGNWLNLGKHPQYPGQPPVGQPPVNPGANPGPNPGPYAQGPYAGAPGSIPPPAAAPGAWQTPFTGSAWQAPFPGQNPYGPPAGGPVDPNAQPIPPDPSAYWRPVFGRGGAPVGAIILIGLGALFLMGQLDIFHGRLIEFSWPVFLIGLGVWLVVRRLGESQGGPK